MQRFARCVVLVASLGAPAWAEARMKPECKAALAEADRAAKKGDRAAARAALDEAAKVGGDPASGGECLSRVFAKRAELSTQESDHRSAARYYRQGAHRAAEGAAQWRALTQARIAAEARAKHKATADRLAKLLTLEAAVSALERRPAVGKAGGAAAERALGEAREAFAADKDPVRRDWTEAVTAKVLAANGDHEAARAKAEVLAYADAQPTWIRAVAHEALMLAAQSARQAEAEARAALWVDHLRAELAGRTPEERRFARSRDTDRACARYEKAAGEGACAALALASTGAPSFTDPSRARPKRTVSQDEIERAQRQYSPAVEACVRDAAKANADGELFENASVKIGWAVRADGRTQDVEIEPKRYEGALGACVRERVGWFRYPRATDGQVHSIVLPFRLEVTERFGGRH